MNKSKKSLIIVESPAKIKTLRKFLGNNYILESSVGHIRDLPEKGLGIDIQQDFEPTYEVLSNKKDVIDNLVKAAKHCDVIYLAPDPDREGEAIAWHLSAILPKEVRIRRITFHSITKEAVLKALEHPRDIDQALVNAQQARRLLDRIVGYKISPILNRRIRRGREQSVSAGRVQSVALKLVVDREKEIEAFKPIEYWNLGAVLNPPSSSLSFHAYLYSVDGAKVEKEMQPDKAVTTIPNQTVADQVVERLKSAAYSVQKIEKKEKRRNPEPPFITSTLQQEASRHHGFGAARTMNIAQKLYEGVELGSAGAEGLITYMRTDSVRIAPEAIQEARGWIQKQYGNDYLPKEPRHYVTKKSAQDAHEAIRPTRVENTPEKLAPYLTKEQFQLYQLIWKRFVASQMSSAIYDTVSAEILAAPGLILRATGSQLKFQGFLILYEEKRDEEDKGEEGRLLPPLEEGFKLKLVETTSDQAFTRPPPRYSEATLVKELEKSGIGRPSTYATIMNKIQNREYTVKEGGRLKPTELGRVIAALLENNFQQIMNVNFTAQMEDELEHIAENRKDWKALMREFWAQFSPVLETAEKEAFIPRVETDLICPSCGAKLQKIWFKNKYFYGCSRYPDCTYSAPVEALEFNKDEYAEDFDWNQPCPVCGSEMKLRHGRFGAFLGCTNYPQCRGVVRIPKKGEAQMPADTSNLPACPAKGCPGKMVARRSRFGKVFYSCSTFPDCDVIVNALDQLETKYADHQRTPYVKKESTRGAKKPAAKGKAAKDKTAKDKEKKEKKEKKPAKQRTSPALTLSPELAAIVGSPESTRPDVLKKLWDYIREKGLQNPQNKRQIVPDAALGKVFGSQEPVDMMRIGGLISPHIQSAKKGN